MSEYFRPTELAAEPSADMRGVFAQALNVLTDTELAIFLQLCTGHNHQEIANDYGISRQAVNDTSKRVIKKLDPKHR